MVMRTSDTNGRVLIAMSAMNRRRYRHINVSAEKSKSWKGKGRCWLTHAVRYAAKSEIKTAAMVNAIRYAILAHVPHALTASSRNASAARTKDICSVNMLLNRLSNAMLAVRRSSTAMSIIAKICATEATANPAKW